MVMNNLSTKKYKKGTIGAERQRHVRIRKEKR